MTQTVAILGRQPALGLVELESLYGAPALQLVGDQAALIDVDPTTITFDRLGGSIKLAKLLTIQDTTNWGDIEKWLIEAVAPHTDHLPPGKMDVGLSAYGFDKLSPQRINATALEVKKAIRGYGRSVRIVPNKTADLSSAQVLHNNLTGERGWELLFIRHSHQTYVAQTVKVQDINAYAARDQRRPKRDARVGMLPPKLAQIIINLAGTHTLKSTGQPPTPEQIAASPTSSPTKLLDPFCGTGVILQEALLMGYDSYGTDVEDRMVDYSKANLDWLAEQRDLNGRTYLLETGDATNFDWQSFDVIATETYLGRPFSALPAPDVLKQVTQDVDTIHRKFLKHVAQQTPTGFRMCLAVPAWKTPNGFQHLKVLDSLEELGYTRTVFSHVRTEELVYHRPNQIVARELVVLTRK